jgi:hypothetical protein
MREATRRNRFGRDVQPQGTSHGLFRHCRQKCCKAHQAGASEQAERDVTGTGRQAASVGNRLNRSPGRQDGVAVGLAEPLDRHERRQNLDITSVIRL